MAVFVQVELAGVTTQQYDALNAKLQAAPGNPFEGCLSHVAVATDSGLRIFDLWESEEAMHKFEGVMMPFAAEMGLSGGTPPKPSPVHNYWLPGK